jgi:hypothetical protein
MIYPRFVGSTDDGGPYQLSAHRAERPPGKNQPIELIEPVYRTSTGLVMLAPHGVYDEAANTVIFDGDVLVRDRRGNLIRAPSMILDLERGTLRGQGGITGADAG